MSQQNGGLDKAIRNVARREGNVVGKKATSVVDEDIILHSTYFAPVIVFIC